jgi:cbb3-type cytochrome oxidase maturation protein
MAVMYVLLPVALLFAGGALALFFWALRAGQFDDLDTPPLRILVEDDAEGGGGAAPRAEEGAAGQP